MKKILLIDDEPDIREIAQLSLEMSSDWTIKTAASGPEGIETAKVYQPDVILLDVMMPDMDGPSTFENLKNNQETQGIAVIFLTAKAQTREQRRYLELGAKAVLTKPFNPLTLGSEITQAMEW